MLIHLDSENFDEIINKKDKIVLVDFYATWCGPCQMLSPIIEEIAEDYPEIDVVKVDIDKFRDIAIDNGIEVVPTMVFFRDGKKEDEIQGYIAKDIIEEEINRL